MKVINVRTQPLETSNSFSVTINTHESAAGAPIEMQAGCSWTELTIDGARELIRELQGAIEVAALSRRELASEMSAALERQNERAAEDFAAGRKPSGD